MKVACLGAGYFSQFHIAAWRRIAGVALVGVCDNDHERASATGLPAFSDLDMLLDKACPDILDIILPPAAHAAAIDKAIAAGVKTIICQKPFCTSLAQAKAVKKLFARLDAHLKDAGCLAMSGQIVDVSIVAAPCQRMTDEENATVKGDGIPQDW